MEIQFSADWATPYLTAPTGPLSIGLGLVLALLIAAIIWKTYRSLYRLGLARLLMTIGLAAGGSLLAGSTWLVLKDPALGWALGPRLPIAGLVPLVLAAWFLGVLPAGLTGLAVGFVTAGQTDHSVLSVLGACLAGLSIGLLLRQDYQGRLFAWLRRPVVATVLVSILLWPIPLWRSLCVPLVLEPVGGWRAQVQYLLLLLAPGLLAGLLMEAIHLLAPGSQPVRRPVRTAAHQRSLTKRLIAALIPLLLLATFGAAYGVNLVAVRTVTNQLESSLQLTTKGVQNELEWSRRATESTLTQLALEIAATPETLTQPRDLDAAGLFAALWVFSPSGEPISAQRMVPDIHPPDADSLNSLIQEPTRWAWTEDGHLLVLAPVTDRAGSPLSYLVAAIPAKDRMALALPERPTGHSFLGPVFAKPEGASLDQAWLLSSSGTDPDQVHLSGSPRPTESGSSAPQRFLTANGDLVVVVSLPSHGLEMATVATPRALFAASMLVSMPFLIMLALGITSTALVYFVVTAKSLEPLSQLVSDARRAARGHWPVPLQALTPDEVGRLSLVIEEMRRSSQAHSQQIALLAELSDASGSRADLRRSLDDWLRELVAGLTTARRPILFENLIRSPRPERFAPALVAGAQALAIVPLVANGTYLGMLYLQYPTPQTFPQMERGFLKALARQAALLIGHVEATARWHRAEQQLKALLEASFDPAIILSGEGELLAANRSAEHAFGFDMEEERGKAITPDLAGEGLYRFAARLTASNPPLTSEIATRSHRTFSVRAAPFGQGKQHPAGWILAARDLSDLKRLDALKRDFVAAFSHDLKTPLQYLHSLITAIPMIAELTLKQKELIERCVEELDGASDLIEGIVELAKIESVRQLRLLPCQLPALLSQAMDAHRVAAREKRIRVHLELGSQPPLIIADQEMILTAIGHLLENAIRFTPPGGQVILALTEDEEWVILQVKDTGIGIPSDEQHRVFERFYRGRDAVDTGIPGNGLGLSAVRAVAAAHGGKVWLDSEVGRGSSFYIALPKDAHRANLPEGLPEETTRPSL